MIFTNGGLDYALLLMLRISALIFSSPIFGRSNIPRSVRAGFCFMLTVLFYMALPPGGNVLYATFWQFAGLCLKELIFGLAMGWVTTLFFQLPFVSGSIIDMQIGFGMVNVLDPSSNLQVPITGNILNIVLLMVFFVVNGHHTLIDLVAGSVQRVPIGGAQIHIDQLMVTSVEFFSRAFLLAIQVAMPVVAAAMMTEVALGLMIRAVPQLNMYVAGLPIKVFFGLVLLLVIMPPYITMTATIYDGMYNGIANMFEGLVPAP